MRNLTSVFNNKSGLILFIFALIVGGVGAQASGILNSPEGGYLVCVDSKTKVVTHPGTSNCPKGTKKLVLGAQGPVGLTGATGLPGKDGLNGKDGKTLWNGVKDPESTWGAPGDMFINSVTKTLFGPKNLDGTWPVGVSMVGPKGDQGPIGLTGPIGPQGPIGSSGPAGPSGANGRNGTNATIEITELFVCDGPDDNDIANEKCKIGMIGPGGGLIFFVDYQDQYPGFNYLEAAPQSCVSQRFWSTNFSDVPDVSGWAARAVGSGVTNTAAIREFLSEDTLENNAALFATSCNSHGKTDWFLGSLGEMKLMYDNLQGVGGFLEDGYWSSNGLYHLTEGEYYGATNGAYFYDFEIGAPNFQRRDTLHWVRPVRSF